MIYDCFTFFNENDLLDIRLNILKDVVDKFVIIEATKTHSGIDKPLNFDKTRFKDFQDKIIYVVLDEFPELTNSWVLENYQRNYILNVLKEQKCNDNDTIVISDCDEIPNPDVLVEYDKNISGIKSLEQNFCQYYINLRNFIKPYWYTARILRYKDFFNPENDKNYKYNLYLQRELNQGITPTKVRMMENLPVLKNAGYHFSFCGGADAIIKKLKAFSHQEWNKEKFLSSEHIRKRILNGDSILDTKNDTKMLPVQLDDYPEYIKNNKDKFANLIFEVPNNLKLKFKLYILVYKLRNYIYSKRKDGSKRIITVLGLKYIYQKHTNCE